MSYYGFTKCDINKLNDVNENNTDKYYRYNDIDFYYKKYDNSDKLIIAFHGGKSCSSKTPIPIFRGYNWGFNMLCISDKLLDLYPKLRLSWFLSPTNLSLKNLYIEIIQFFISKYTNVIFTGCSGGGFPALFFSSYFNKKSLIQNSQLYLGNYNNVLNDIINVLNIELGDLGETSCEEIVNKYGSPLHAYIYCHTLDTGHYENHFIPFKKFINDNNLNSNFTFVDFTVNSEKHPHYIEIPMNTTFCQVVQQIFESHNNSDII